MEGDLGERHIFCPDSHVLLCVQRRIDLKPKANSWKIKAWEVQTLSHIEKNALGENVA